MVFYINKIVMAVLDPMMLGILLAMAGIVLMACRWRRTGLGVGIAGIVWLWMMSCAGVVERLGNHLEQMHPPVPIGQIPSADAIVLLGGGMGSNAAVSPFAEMYAAADRVWQAARLFKAGKAAVIIPSGTGEEQSTVPLLLDLGVPREAIRVENAARNTEENAKFVQSLLLAQAKGTKPKVLLVTSAWHMRRAMLMYQRYASGLEIVPVGCDYEATLLHASPAIGNVPKIFPDAESIGRGKVYFKEIIGYWGYRLLRR